jgi:hypothetical protein
MKLITPPSGVVFKARNDVFTRHLHGSVHHNYILISSNKMQQYAGIYLLQNYSTYFGCPSHPSSGVHKNVTVASGTGHSNNIATNFLQCSRPNLTGHVEGRLLLRYYDLYQRLQLQFYVLLMSGLMDTRNV